LIERGYSNVDALDISENFISLAKKKFDDKARFIVGNFNDPPLPKDRYALILFAQSFHWTNSSLRLARVHSLLQNGGYIAILNNYFTFPTSDMGQRVHSLYKKYCPDFPDVYVEKNTMSNERIELEEKNFEISYAQEYPWELSYTKDQYCDLQRTFSWVLALTDDKRDAFLQEIRSTLDGQKEIIAPLKTVLLIGQKQNE
jgi:ubiquinone/menaquinone biosynthesis C-methylase UbiE